MNNCCRNCRFFHMAKYFDNGKWKFFDICTVFPETESGYDAFALVVDGEQMCEMWTAM